MKIMILFRSLLVLIFFLVSTSYGTTLPENMTVETAYSFIKYQSDLTGEQIAICLNILESNDKLHGEAWKILGAIPVQQTAIKIWFFVEYILHLDVEAREKELNSL